MPVYGYAWVSTFDQDLTLQRTALAAAGCGVIRAETASGSRRDGRSELQVLLDFVQPGDTLVVTRIDRLARSMKDLQDIVHELKAKGEGQGGQLARAGAAGRHRHRGWQGVPRHAGRVRRVRDQPAQKAPAKGSKRPRPRPRASVGAGSPASTWSRCVGCATRPSSAHPPSPSSSASAEPRSTGCWGRSAHRHRLRFIPAATEDDRR